MTRPKDRESTMRSLGAETLCDLIPGTYRGLEELERVARDAYLMHYGVGRGPAAAATTLAAAFARWYPTFIDEGRAAGRITENDGTYAITKRTD